MGDEFVELLSDLTGFDRLIADPAMDGGANLHQSFRDGFLDVRPDFTTNHRQPTWRRRVNVLLYLNRRWSAGWGGALELWDPAVTRCVRSVEPLGNRMVIFTTADHAFHGHPEPLRCPEGTAWALDGHVLLHERGSPRAPIDHYGHEPTDG